MILILNSGSQSIKYALFDENLKEKDRKEIKSFKELKTKENIKIIGHRIVHGANEFKKPVLIDKKVIKKLEKISYLAPLHNPYNLRGVKYCTRFKVSQYAVFDTEFYSNLPEKAKVYALPKKIIKKHKIQRYGFHGISHEYAGKKAAQLLKKSFNKINLITCHLGGGSSVTAI
ncbi:MAG: acetate kinase, partial [Candidatus Pacebacteria bacterium]|nr:acetate kinase [Candidatus Paceibacterota bacterium]